MTKKNKRKRRHTSPNTYGAFGNSSSQHRAASNPRTLRSDAGRTEISCQYPHLYDLESRCCICGGNIRDCKCGPQDAINHFVLCHGDNDCETAGHPEIAMMVMMGYPQPTVPCRNCGNTPQFGEVEVDA